jgi:hypothetical protein
LAEKLWQKRLEAVTVKVHVYVPGVEKLVVTVDPDPEAPVESRHV